MTSRPPLYALVVGVDAYEAPTDGLSPAILPLRGAVRDAERMRGFLRRDLGVADERIEGLTASHGAGDGPREGPTERATLANLIAAFRRLGERAAPGEQVVICFSGHGAQLPTLVPEVKGSGGKDEALVPCDAVSAADGKLRVLRDLELAKLVAELVERGILVTLVLDSCHAGGALRGGGERSSGVGSDGLPAVRCAFGLAAAATSPAPPLAPPAELATLWRRLTRGGYRDFAPASGWLPTMPGLAMIAACRANEYAFEDSFPGFGASGLLTHHLLEELAVSDPLRPYRDLHAALLTRIHGGFTRQTPQLEGDEDRPVFGAGHRALRQGMVVLRAEPGGRLLIDGGLAHGVGVGARLAVYPGGTNAGGEVHEAIVEQADGVRSWARLSSGTRSSRADGPIDRGEGGTPWGGGGEIEAALPAGSVAELLATGVERPARRVGAVAPFPAEDLADLRAAVGAASGSWLRWESADDRGVADWRITVTPAGEYAVLDRVGRAISYGPTLLAADAGAGGEMVQRLEHLARRDHLAAIGGALVLEVRSVSAARPLDLAPASSLRSPAIPTVEVGETIELLAVNRGGRAFFVTVLDLAASGAVAMVLPGPGQGSAELLRPRARLSIRLRAALPAWLDEGVDRFRLFATEQPTDFRWLELPRFGERPAPGSGEASAPERGGGAVAPSEWVVLDAEVQVTRRKS